MKTLHLCLALLLSVFLTSCENPRTVRIRENPAMLAKLPPEHQEAVQQGAVLKGMSPDAVYLAMGRPVSISSGSESGKSAETWVYRGYRAVPTYDNYWYQTSRGGYYGPIGPDYNYIPYNRAIITFLNEKVVALQRGF